MSDCTRCGKTCKGVMCAECWSVHDAACDRLRAAEQPPTPPSGRGEDEAAMIARRIIKADDDMRSGLGHVTSHAENRLRCMAVDGDMLRLACAYLKLAAARPFTKEPPCATE